MSETVRHKGKKGDTLLIEIGTEELPPASLKKMSYDLAFGFSRRLRSFIFTSSREWKTFRSPRRLAFQFAGTLDRKEASTTGKSGPCVENAYDEDGNPTQAALGFAKACGVEVYQLEQYEYKGKQRLYFERQEPKRHLKDELPSILEAAVKSLSIPKRMRWGDNDFEFIRPVQWLCVLYGEQIIPCELFGVKSSNLSYGHRQSSDNPIQLNDAKDYEGALAQAGIKVNFEERKNHIKEMVEKAASNIAGALYKDQNFDEITALTECPQVLVAEFDSTYLSLPDAVILQVLQHALKAFPVQGEDGKLLAKFIVIVNMVSPPSDVVRQGYQRVVHPRLTDAAFFIRQDRKTPFDMRGNLLSGIVFQDKIGTLADKTKRIEQLGTQLAEVCKADRQHVADAAQRCKYDLSTQIVTEYPKLEGVIGSIYAQEIGVHESASAAIAEHYLPRFSGDNLPSSNTGIALALADKIDTLVGLFGIGHAPTGTKDPFGLRRAVLGITRILIEKEIDLDLKDVIQMSARFYSASAFDNPEYEEQLLKFMQARVETYWVEQGVAHDHVYAVTSVYTNNPFDAQRRLHAIDCFTQLPEAESLIASNKRIRNILRKQSNDEHLFDSSHLQEAAELALYDAFCVCQKSVEPLLAKKQYLDAMQDLAQLHAPITQFFDDVLVMSDNERERQTRLSLLQQIHNLFMQFADFSILHSKSE